MTVCLHCGTDCQLTTGRVAYPHRPDQREKPFWKCPRCDDSLVGCHPGTTDPLGYAADKPTRKARRDLHVRMLDPLWLKSPRAIRKGQRHRVYAFLAMSMGLTIDKTHTGMWTEQQCREAWMHLFPQSARSIHEWYVTEGKFKWPNPVKI